MTFAGNCLDIRSIPTVPRFERIALERKAPSAKARQQLSKRRLIVCVAGVALACAVFAVHGAADDTESHFNFGSVPFMEYGGAFERGFRVVPPVHDFFWKVPPYG